MLIAFAEKNIVAARHRTDLYSDEAEAGHRNCRSASLFASFSWLAPSTSSFPYDVTKRTPKHTELVSLVNLRNGKRNRANVRANDEASNGQRVLWSSQARREGCAATRICRAMRRCARAGCSDCSLLGCRSVHCLGDCYLCRRVE